MIRLALILSLMASMAQGAGPVDPDWPCVQRKQPQLSVAQLWTGPLPDEGIEERAKDPKIRKLGQGLAQRRLSLDEAEVQVAKFAETASAADVTALFLASFQQIQEARKRVMAGITRYAHKQEALDAQIKALRQEFTKLSAAESPDFDAIDKIEAEIDWSTRIFQDRQQSLIYVCETPVILEQRAFALGRIISAQLKKN